MSLDRKRKLARLAVRIPVVALAAVGLLTLLVSLANGTIRRIVFGPEVVMSAVSPDGEYEAYVVNHPTIDPPYHQVYVERAGKVQFLPVTRTFGGLDRVEQLVWSPTGDVLVVRTRRHLVAVRVPEFHSLDLHLGMMWHRKQPQRGWSFAMGAQMLKISEVDLSQLGTLRVRFEGSDDLHEFELPYFGDGQEQPVEQAVAMQ